MEANELMIGDWVRIIDYSKKRKRTVIGMVTDLCCTGAVYIFHGEDELCYETNDDILPINITDDILDKNFEKCSNANSQPIYKITPSLFIGINHNLCHITTKSGDNFKVRHIHELQHIMRLLGLIEQANNIRI